MITSYSNFDKNTISVNPANYAALAILDYMDIDAPSQKQIDIIETMILVAVKPKLISFKLVENCFADNNVAGRMFSRYLRNKLNMKEQNL